MDLSGQTSRRLTIGLFPPDCTSASSALKFRINGVAYTRNFRLDGALVYHPGRVDGSVTWGGFVYLWAQQTSAPTYLAPLVYSGHPA